MTNETFVSENWELADEKLSERPDYDTIIDMIDDSEFIPEIGHVYQLDNGRTIVIK